jgi:uncharacterized repeat protein (TIGR03803 family)
MAAFERILHIRPQSLTRRRLPQVAVLSPPSGGKLLSGGASIWGVVFKLDTTGTETVLYSFTGGADGAEPYAGLLRDSAGNLYGTTVFGGASNWGVVFKLNKTGETVLHSYTGGADGGGPSQV